MPKLYWETSALGENEWELGYRSLSAHEFQTSHYPPITSIAKYRLLSHLQYIVPISLNNSLFSLISTCICEYHSYYSLEIVGKGRKLALSGMFVVISASVEASYQKLSLFVG
jgi:hypothetical protein